MSKSVLITGAAGFIGSYLSEYYLEKKYKVILVDNFCTGLQSNITELTKKYKSDVLFFEKDVCEKWTWTKEIPKDWTKELTYVLHFASPASPPIYQKIPKQTLWTNALGLENALQFADQHGARLVYASTSEVYGDPLITPQPETYWGNTNSFGARSCYDEGKRFGEALIYSHNFEHQKNHGLVRIFNTYGPRMNPADGRVIINFMTQAMRGEDLTIYGSGEQTRSFCFITDLVNGITRYVDTSLAEPVNIGNPTEFTVLQAADEIRKMFPEKKLKLMHLKPAADDPKQRRPDISKATRLLGGWKPEVPFAMGLQHLMQWLQTHQHLAKAPLKKAGGF